MASIRRIAPDDSAILKRVRLTALRDAPSAFGSTYEVESVQTEEAWAERALAGSRSDQRATFFAEADGQVIGLVGGYRATPESSRVELVSMWVAPGARRQGIARRLVEAVVGWAAASNAADVALWVTDGNAAAEELYRGTAFRPTGARKALPSDPSKSEYELILQLENP